MTGKVRGFAHSVLPSNADLLLACDALGKLVREDYPDYPLNQIAREWGAEIGVTRAEMAALDRVVEHLEETDDRHPPRPHATA
jgi:hypothetical protein